MTLTYRRTATFDAELSFYSAMEHLRDGDIESAIALLTDALIIEPKCVEYLIQLASANILRGDSRSLGHALTYLSQIPMKQIPLPDKPLLGQVLEELGEYDKARDAYFSALESDQSKFNSNELSVIHTRLTALSEMPGFEINRPCLFKIPDVDRDDLEITFGGKPCLFQLRIFKKPFSEVRLISLPSIYGIDGSRIDVDWRKPQRLVSLVKRVLGESNLIKPFLPKGVVWIFHFMRGAKVAHELQKLEEGSVGKDDRRLYLTSYTHTELEGMTNWRLLWRCSHGKSCF